MPSNPSQQSSELSGERKFTIPITIVFTILSIWSIVQGIIAITFGSLFYSFSLSTFGISSIGQLVIIFYIYHKLLTEHYMKSLLSTATETTPILNNRNGINARRKTEKRIAICGMFVFIIFSIVTLISLFYINKKIDDHPEHNQPPPPGDDDDDFEKRRPTLYILLFSVYAIHPFFILIPAIWYLSSITNSLVWREATIWTILFFFMAYIQFINSQLLYFVTWKTREMVCTLLMAILFLIYAARLGWMYLRRGGNIEDQVRPAINA
ncbi:11876_t:CDS:1 [Funneliformis geosporum]|uniref:13310_t:CDS:1 n=1 Tax=Funneliformis geosporum TaxID=1117311 RepID=A0A9W4WY58_9GLOM|nr:11876_t:CDS:1 [Funneliformis geosporum]CAI2172335.1 13310_t:CDS:1 [Funneliformis geosporum]